MGADINCINKISLSTELLSLKGMVVNAEFDLVVTNGTLKAMDVSSQDAVYAGETAADPEDGR